MRKKRRRQLSIIAVVLGVGVYVVLLNSANQTGVLSGDFSTMITYVLNYFGHLVGIALGFVLLIKDKGNYSTTPIRLMIMTSFIGVVFSSLFYRMNTDGIWVDEIVTPSYTITEFQFTVMLFFFFIGILLGLMKRK